MGVLLTILGAGIAAAAAVGWVIVVLVSAVVRPCASIVMIGTTVADPIGPVAPGPVFFSARAPVPPAVASPLINP